MRNYVWNEAGQLLNDDYVVTNLAYSSSLKYSYDALLRPKTLKNLTLGTTTGYGYDAASRLSSITEGINKASYTYQPYSSLITNVTFQNNGVTRLTTTKAYDNLNRLTAISSVSASATFSFDYGFNSANQRTTITNADASRWVYDYDNLGQVISGKRCWPDGTPVAGQQFEYGFDDIGNRSSTGTGGDQTGANLRSASYTANLLNQYSERSVPGAVDVMGSAHSNATVTVNSAATYRKGEYYRAELTVDNTSAAVYQSITNEGVLTPDAVDITGNFYVAATAESYDYDLDGNLLKDGRFTYAWDGENRVIAIESLTNAPPASKRKVQMAYDEFSRRMFKRVWVWNTTTNGYALATEKRFWYDGWNLIGEVDSASSQVQTFVWGLA